jgi:hypothetical protein
MAELKFFRRSLHLAGVEPATFGSVGGICNLPKSLKTTRFAAFYPLWAPMQRRSQICILGKKRPYELSFSVDIEGLGRSSGRGTSERPSGSVGSRGFSDKSDRFGGDRTRIYLASVVPAVASTSRSISFSPGLCAAHWTAHAVTLVRPLDFPQAPHMLNVRMAPSIGSSAG